MNSDGTRNSNANVPSCDGYKKSRPLPDSSLMLQ